MNEIERWKKVQAALKDDLDRTNDALGDAWNTNFIDWNDTQWRQLGQLLSLTRALELIGKQIAELEAINHDK